MPSKAGKLLTALAVAYQVQCRLSDVAPVRAKGFDHTTQGSYAVAAGVSKALVWMRSGLPMRSLFAGPPSMRCGFPEPEPYLTGRVWPIPNTAFSCTHATFLAMRGITGPLEVFEGNKGFMDAIAGRFKIDWSAEKISNE